MNLAELKKMKLLLVDDDEWIRDSMRLFFQSEGCDLVTLETAEEALEMIEKQPFDIIIADFRLPGMDGIELFKRIPGPSRRAMKILITAYLNKEIESSARQVGIHDLIEKPIKAEAIEESLSKFPPRISREDANHA